MRVYEKHPYADAFRVGRAYVPYAIVAKDKRFSDAELAAEGYKLKAEMLSLNLHQADLRGEGDLSGAELFEADRWRKVEQGHTIQRFAGLPHYDEDDQ